jgi:nucleotide-binding universal stress UspA family protein
MYKKILVPLDGSALCANALDPAVNFAKESGAEVTLLHVVPYMTLYTEREGSICDFCEPDKQQQDVAEQFLSQQAKGLKAKGVEKVSTKILTGERPAHTIIEYAQENKVDLIVMSTHGRSGFSHMWLGSVAEKVVRKGSEFASVFLIRCKAE